MDPIERIQIRVSDDGLEAWAGIIEGPSAPDEASSGILARRLDKASVRAGLDSEAIEGLARALAQPTKTLQDRCIARGRAPQPGAPAFVELRDPAGLQPGSIRPDGSLDFKERQLLLPLERGEQIGQVVPASSGKPGWDVHGDAIEPEPATDEAIRTGEGVEVDDSGRLWATRSGTRTISADGTIDVVDHHVHTAPVDLRSGNLATSGSLEVKRDVMPGMSVQSGFDLRIAGVVDGARIRAGGSIEIAGGAIGREGGSVVAGGDLQVRHALGIRLEARGRLRIVRSVSTSQLVAREIEVGGRMLSDWLQAESRVVLKDAGSPAGGPCLLRAAHPLEPPGPCPPSGGATALRSTRPEAHRNGTLRTRKGRRTARARPHAEPRTAAEELEARRAWRRRQRELQRIATIEIHGTAHAGCRIDLGVTPLVLESDVSKRRFRVDLDAGRVLEEEL